MAFKLRGSHLIAAAICAAIGGWMYTGELIIGGQAGTAGAAKPIAEREKERTAGVFKVRVQTLQPLERNAQLLIRGRTEAHARITVRAETAGTLTKRVVNKGDQVKPGDLLCEIDRGIRDSNLAQAQAKLDQAKADFEAKDGLAKKGYSTKANLRLMRALMNSATASLEAAKQDLAWTEIRSAVSGEVTGPLAEMGDHLSKGGVCVTLIDVDPMLFIGQVSERDISRIATGMNAGVQLVTGEQVLGKITYIAPHADPKTRTFRVEMAIGNSEHKLRDGVTAASIVQLESTTAYVAKPSWLTLADNGVIGMRGVDDDNKVIFVPVKILSQAEEGIWVTGIKPGTRMITVGHEYVTAGEVVIPVADNATGDEKSKKSTELKQDQAIQTAEVAK